MKGVDGVDHELEETMTEVGAGVKDRDPGARPVIIALELIIFGRKLYGRLT